MHKILIYEYNFHIAQSILTGRNLFIMRKALTLFFLLAFMVSASFAADYVPGDVIVVLRNDSGVSIGSVASSSGGVKSLSSVQSFAQSSNVSVKKTFDALSDLSNSIFMVVHSDNEDAKSLLRKISSNPNVLAASLNTIYHIEAVSKDLGTVPEDKEYHRLWGMEAINAPYAWNYSKGSDNVYVAVVDSGIDYEHPDIADNFAAEYSMNFVAGTNYTEASYYDENNHGTHVAGTIGAVGDNGIGVAGVNWNVKLISVRVIGADGRGNGQTLLAGMNYVASLLKTYPEMKLAAMNYSIGGGWFYTPEEIITENHPQYLALKAISDTNRTVICVAAGNSSTEVGAPVFYANFNTIAQGTYAYPASFRGIDNMIVVAAAKSDMTRASFSNYSGKYVDIAAPGQGIYSTVAQDNKIDLGYDKVTRNYPYAMMSGTSMATPHVTGAAALLKSLYPNATASQIKASIVGGANGSVLRDDGTSMYGMLDIRGAIDYMNGRLYESATPEISDAKPAEGVVNQSYSFKFYASGSEPITWSLDGELPEGLSFDNGMIIGTPTSEESKTIFVTAENEYGYDSAAYTIKINKGIRPVIIHDVEIQPARIGSSWDMYLRLSQGTWPFTWEITNSADIVTDIESNDAAAISIDKYAGYIELLPKKEKTYKITVKVSNYAGEDSININVPATNGIFPTIEEKTLKNAIAGKPYGMSTPSDFPSSYNINPNSMSYGDTIKIDSLSDFTFSIIAPSNAAEDTSTDKYGKLPAGITAEENDDGIYLSGTPTEAATYHFAVEVKNTIGAASRDFEITVEDSAPLFLSDTYELTYAKDVQMDLRIPVLGTPEVTFTYAGAFPENVSFTAEDLTAVFTGSPTKTGTYSGVLTATNIYGTTTANVIITVSDPAVITTSTIPDAVKGEVYSFNFSSLNDVALSWSVNDNALSDSGLIMSSSGELYGAPTKAGDYRFTVTASASDGSGLSDSKTYLLRILDKAAITSESTLHAGVINTVYEPAQLEYSGTAPVYWTLTEGNLPAGLGMTTNGYIHGTPTEAGTFTFTARAANTAGYDTKSFMLSITDGTIPVTPPTPGSTDSPDTPVNPPAEVSPDKPIGPQIRQGRPRSFSALTDNEREILSQERGYIVAILPEISVDVSGVYSFDSVDSFANVNSSPDVPAGALLVWHSFRRNTSNNSESSSSALDVRILADESTSETSDTPAVFYDTEGNVIDSLPENKILNISAYLEAGITYAPVISAVTSTASQDTTTASQDSTVTSSDSTVTPTTSPDTTVTPVTSSDTTVTPTTSSDTTVTPTTSPDKTITPDTPVKPTVTLGNPRTTSSLMLNERAVIAQENGLIAAMLPEISVNVSGIYTYDNADVFANVELSSNIPVGYALVWHPFVHTSIGSYVEASDSDTDQATFYDTEGNVIYTVPSDRTVNISAYLEAGKVYAPVVAAVSGGGNTGAHSSSGGGGCEFGLSALALILCAVIFRKNSR